MEHDIDVSLMAGHEVFAKFSQTWNSSALAVNEPMIIQEPRIVETIVMKEKNTYSIYASGNFCYEVENPNEKFFEDVKNASLVEKHQSKIYLNSDEEIENDI